MNVVVALLAAVCVSVLCALALAFPLHGLSPAIAAASLGAGAVAGALQYAACLRGRGTALQARKITGWEWAVIAVYTLFTLRAFCWLVFFNDDKIIVLSDNNLGDLPLHLTYINNLASGVPFWPENPIFAGDQLHYPVGIDIFNSLLKLVGVDVYRGLIWVGLAGSLLTGIALYKWGRGFALAGFLFNGGLAGFQFFRHFHFEDYQQEFAWKSIPLSMLVTQRGLLYAIPAGLVLLWSWRARFFPGTEKESEKPLPFWTEVLLYSTMPLFHVHTFIFLSFLLGCWMVMTVAPYYRKHFKWITPAVALTSVGLLGLLNSVAPTTLALAVDFLLLCLIFIWLAWIEKPKMLMQLLKLIVWSLVPGTLLMALITGFFKSKSIIHFVNGGDWQYSEQPSLAAWADSLHAPHWLTPVLGYAANWIVNFGALPFFAATLVYAIFISRSVPSFRRAGAFVLPSLALFIISCFVMFAKWDWDNTKIMIWCYLAVLPFLWDQLLAREKFPLRAACCFMLYFSGFISLFGGIDGSHDGQEIALRSEVDGIATAVKPLPVTAIFAGYPTYNHPLLLDGRKMVEGYSGHLDSYGIDYAENLAMLESLLNGDPGWRETARKLHARYLFWGRMEEENYPNSTEPWDGDRLKVAEGDWGTIYDLDAPAAQNEEPKTGEPQ